MKSDIKGVSTVQSGKENHETFKHGENEFVQYEYITEDGKLFSCLAANLEVARMRRDKFFSTEVNEVMRINTEAFKIRY